MFYHLNPWSKKWGPLQIVAFALAAPGFSDAQEADRVFVNGYTVDEAFSTASAIAIKDGRFIVGSDAGAQAHISSTTFVSDLEGKTVIPAYTTPTSISGSENESSIRASRISEPP